MASSSGCTQQLGEVKVSDAGCGMDESSEVLVSEYVTAHAMESELGSPSCELLLLAQSELGSPSCESFLSAQYGSIVGGLEILSLGERGGSRIKEEIERSKQHWSLLADPLESGEVDEGVVAEVDNVEVFKALQMHPTWGQFFCTFGHDVGLRFESLGELVLGEKFAEGGQAELYHAKVTWRDTMMKEWDMEHRREWVVKVFKKGTFLRQVHKALPHGYLQFQEEEWRNWKSSMPKQFPRYYCEVGNGILLEDGRFAFLMRKEHTDLRILIEEHLRLRGSKNCGPFSYEDAECLMYKVAMGVKWLHEHDIVHRDLKASNVLVCELQSGWSKWACYVADYECSVGVVGTGFFRALEILQACKDGQVHERQDVFSKAADVYSYGMTCYEILTGKLPYGPQVSVPEYVDDWTNFLLSRCWQLNPLMRPSMEEIVNSFLDHSPKIKEIQEDDIEYFRKLSEQS